jgi:hypothetical protein
MDMSGGHNKKPLMWNGMYFKSISALAEYEGIKRCGMAYVLKWNKPFHGHEIIYL